MTGQMGRRTWYAMGRARAATERWGLNGGPPPTPAAAPPRAGMGMLVVPGGRVIVPAISPASTPTPH